MSRSASEIHQLVHTLSYGDAISGEVLALQRCFVKAGAASEIYAINIHPRYKGQARYYTELRTDFSGEVVFHYSLGSPLNDLYRKLTRAKRSLIYHNLTPAHWFKGVNPRIVMDIENGWRELPELCDAQVTGRLVADSNYNAGELSRLGFKARVLELPLDPERWSIPANEGIQALLSGEAGIQVLHVGRLAPNKRLEDIIKVFYFLHHYLDEKSKLWLVGIDTDTELYSFALKRLAHQLELEQAVNFVGCMADSELKALYQTSTVYLCMSEHEGFCLPVVEAMYFDLPVIAYACTATSDTVAEGGILVHEKKYPEIAELIGELAHNEELRRKIIQAGKRRAERLSFERFDARVRSLWGLEK